LRAFVPKLPEKCVAGGFGVFSVGALVFNKEKAAFWSAVANGINACKAELRESPETASGTRVSVQAAATLDPVTAVLLVEIRVWREKRTRP